jgi:hypothetical protein
VNPSQRVAAYLNAIYAPQGPVRWRLRVGRRAAAFEAGFPRARSFALITAWNPESRPTDDDVNRRAQDALVAELGARGLKFHPATSSDADGGFREAGHCVFDVTRGALAALAARHGQAGTLWWPRGRAVRLQLHRTDWYDAARAAAVDLRHVDPCPP